MQIIHISAATGPVECCLAVLKTLKKLCNQADEQNLKYDFLALQNAMGEFEGAEVFSILQKTWDNPIKKQKDLPKSITVSIEGENEISEQQFINRWIGTIQWICPSPFRPNHKRKNWFIGLRVIENAEQNIFSDKDIQITTMRASGAGGQHINKTNSAVRITHIPTGLSVRVESQRSQHQNRKMALLLLNAKLQEKNLEQMSAIDKTKHQHHHEIERGNPVRSFKGMNFIEI